MDPNENLRRQIELARRLQMQADREKAIDPLDALELAELVTALNGWIRKGGFLPVVWAEKQEVVR
jgi:hypothetical protein